MNRRSGFTLNEVMMTVVIVGILAAIAIPNYRKTVELGYWRQAQDLLMAIYNGEQSYYFSHDSEYYPPVGSSLTSTSTMEQWRTIYVDNPHLGSPLPILFTVTAFGGAGFTATAARAGGGPCGEKSLTIDQNRNIVTGGWGYPTCTCCGG